ncbi:uncharacterized protein LOC104887454 [Beta vulgaris subsp. vulgaris]|uniref:uncharacterized protein LOC104887454 n=1 Tax=Beta vulgaris subsp. vulgaris TaxID=3555 RepID=UPI002036B4E1|nr:uncharacterized protein LOC104887454 [Beta vulgaris subsp. vulgaris]
MNCDSSSSSSGSEFFNYLVQDYIEWSQSVDVEQQKKKKLFNTEDDEFFTQNSDAIVRMGASALQKCTAAIRMLAYGSSSAVVNEYLKIALSTARECLLHFVEEVVARFGPEYLRKANANDIERLLHEGERRGFPSMMGSIDYMHWNW